MPDTIIPSSGVLVGRAKLPGHAYPRIVTIRDGGVFDITSRNAPTVRDIAELDNPASYVAGAPGARCGDASQIIENSWSENYDPELPALLSPIDLQAVKASGVTFVASLLERVIEEQAKGDKARADSLREDVLKLIGADLSKIVPGSPAAMQVKEALIARGVWSQYLEVGIGPDAEIFSKGQPMSTVGFGADVGLHPISSWNNPEPEIVLVISSTGRIVGATLGNDVNLRDVEGRSALLLGKAKDNNASGSVGPFVRLFDSDFTIETVKSAELSMRVEGEDGFVLDGHSNMAKISRTPESLVEATIGRHHQYPDGLVLYLGTMFAPVKDRDGPGKGFTHKMNDVVSISTPSLGTLSNRVRLSTECAPWTYGASHLLRDLAKADLL
ncbi:fumarylacetoacetate hydrolase family protein [Phyllobacterium endophyticum]|jgi:fumarylacetoacetate (FAA) hydrolase family protein|uniref:Fumarylacetoacetate hydrolase n=1 Tax=Phyllobacterium endophyticum TaxID=1149773 RepID=A0A2P7AM15_9HYPH|nr:fumarylacetoacetate hydrolase family protein [Phyllobacterium endophyticum]MBB3236283.1 fumarylacetoacetate (FAA) hydrolase family protein [Phyllobacterium endophyticum]PSH55241.1 fumarylacetoacetate hydrolase [Phyllobacterium endophyticum]TYR39831.1 fumarylacetoacetate hydrolase family protein [Phyllobacterium endophyticum]